MGRPSSEQAFFERLRDDATDGPRLIYADWLDDQGDAEHAELIRIECALTHLPPDDPRRIELVARCTFLRERNEPRWSAEVSPLVTAWEMRRGIIDSVALTCEQLRECLPQLIALAPVRKVRLLDATDRIQRVASCPSLALVRELDLIGNAIGDEGTFELGRSRYLQQLVALNLSLTDVGDDGVVAIALSPVFESLQSLGLSDNREVGLNGSRHLASIECLPNLIELDLSGINRGPEVFTPLIDSPKRTIEQVHLHTNPLRDGGTARLAESALFARMAGHGRVDLRQVGMGPRGAQALAQSRAMRSANALDLAGNSIGDAGLEALAGSPHLQGLRYLSLRENRISDDGARSLFRSPMLGSLRLLDLTGNLVSEECVEQLLELSVRCDWRGLLEVRTDTKIRQRNNAPVAIRVEVDH